MGQLRALPRAFLFGASLLGHAPAADLPGEEEPREPIADPSPQRFSVCLLHGCRRVAEMGLTGAQWGRIRGLFSPPARDAAQERERIARAIGVMETMVGKRLGTDRDRGGGWRGLFTTSPQQDCIDESNNSTTYLRIMADAGVLRWHTIEAPVTRGHVIFGHPHTTAVVGDAATGEDYAVDSWFRDNGQPAVIVPLSAWRRGWRPQ
jgi:hypothetical protein